jgi:predicted transcriptional regulator
LGTDIIYSVVRTIVQLPDEQAVALERAARRRGISKAAVVREALRQLLGPEEASDDEAVRRALAAAGCFASGVPDLAEHHDDYLAQL